MKLWKHFLHHWQRRADTLPPVPQTQREDLQQKNKQMYNKSQLVKKNVKKH